MGPIEDSRRGSWCLWVEKLLSNPTEIVSGRGSARTQELPTSKSYATQQLKADPVFVWWPNRKTWNTDPIMDGEQARKLARMLQICNDSSRSFYAQFTIWAGPAISNLQTFKLRPQLK